MENKLTADLLIVHAAQLVIPLNGWKLKVIKDGAVAVSGEKIIAVGKTKDLSSSVEITDQTTILDASGKVAMPGFVDPHTHAVYTGSRAVEFVLRLQGVSYMEIAEKGGGINSTVRATRKATLEELVDAARSRLSRMLAWGTTTAEVKSGYGLSLSSELKMLKTIQALNSKQPVELVPTFMGAHEFPLEYREDRKGYIDLIINRMIPEVAKYRLAEFCDVFTETGIFTIEESRRILLAGKKYGLTPKVHADEITSFGGAELASEVGAASADHLVHISPQGIAAMAESKVVPVILPGTSFFLNSNYAPARNMISTGLPVAIATDHNPGTCTIESMPLIISLACLKLGMTPDEAIIASTLNAAKAINRDKLIGSLTPGKQADILVMDIPDYREIPYRFGTNPVEVVIKKGKIAVNNRTSAISSD